MDPFIFRESTFEWFEAIIWQLLSPQPRPDESIGSIYFENKRKEIK